MSPQLKNKREARELSEHERKPSRGTETEGASRTRDGIPLGSKETYDALTQMDTAGPGGDKQGYHPPLHKKTKWSSDYAPMSVS